MDNQEFEIVEKIRQQFDNAPYPRIPLEQSPKSNYDILYVHNLVTAYYLRNQKVIDTEGKVILDAGCGTGYKSLVLAEANPGARIVGIDLSEESVKLAKQRLQYHGFDNANFYVISLEELPSLGLEFDYINCDEVLYLLPDIRVGLQSMKFVLKPDGIIRSNLHSSIQRTSYFCAQKIFKLMGLMNDNPGELEMGLVRETMKSLKDRVMLKVLSWSDQKAEEDEWILSNYLLQGDKGYDITEVFAALISANLEFVSMVNWRQWELTDLFKAPDNLPMFLEMSLPEISMEERLHLFELLHPVHRLIDFWCGHPNKARPFLPVSQWTQSDWQVARVHLHPQLKVPQVKEDLLKCIAKQQSFTISRYIPSLSQVPIAVESMVAACLLPLWEGAQPMMSLVQLWLKLKPLHPATLDPVSHETAFEEVRHLLSSLEAFMYLLLERSA
ncbi:methyltransferase domain-containing protein [Microcoleus sp. bin38.metabat.b11b12b14.051]|uniref:class I SAM-dependent methyltransferase n=1 Tax=Microcoleus sp. bin38.metabat.b11b12b14.051 TaxID=2742709 RepID=UPI0025CD10C3|nr:methyltransferase domain-containing protein [Microcoleus sp. bin38.metabat.b11b12b14.051]